MMCAVAGGQEAWQGIFHTKPRSRKIITFTNLYLSYENKSRKYDGIYSLIFAKGKSDFDTATRGFTMKKHFTILTLIINGRAYNNRRRGACGR